MIHGKHLISCILLIVSLFFALLDFQYYQPSFSGAHQQFVIFRNLSLSLGKCYPWVTNSDSTWELVRNAVLQALSQPY